MTQSGQTYNEGAADLFEHLERQYPEDDVNLTIMGPTVTISRGRRAVQVFAKAPSRFVVSIRMRHTFHMQQKNYDLDELLALVASVVGDSGAGD